MNNLNLSKKMVPAPLPEFKRPDAGLSRDDLLKIVRNVEKAGEPFELDTDIDPEIAKRIRALSDNSDINESVAAIERAMKREAEFQRQAAEDEKASTNERLGESDTASEPVTAGASTSLAYGDADLAELQARHEDWLDEQRTQREALY